MSQSPFLYTFQDRHIGPRDQDIQDMLNSINHDSLDDLIDEIVPESIRLKRPLQLPKGISESEALTALKAMAQKNKGPRNKLLKIIRNLRVVNNVSVWLPNYRK